MRWSVNVKKKHQKQSLSVFTYISVYMKRMYRNLTKANNSNSITCFLLYVVSVKFLQSDRTNRVNIYTHTHTYCLFAQMNSGKNKKLVTIFHLGKGEVIWTENGEVKGMLAIWGRICCGVSTHVFIMSLNLPSTFSPDLYPVLNNLFCFQVILCLVLVSTYVMGLVSMSTWHKLESHEQETLSVQLS